jgi:hypothetical protein
VDIADRQKLSKIVGMLGSAHAGERATAAAFIDAMAKRYKLTVNELMERAFAPASPPPPPPPPAPPPQSSPQQWSNVRGAPSANTELLDVLQTISDNEEAFEFVLTSWECNFAGDVANRYSYDAQLSEKQTNVVRRIVDKVRRANGRT